MACAFQRFSFSLLFSLYGCFSSGMAEAADNWKAQPSSGDWCTQADHDGADRTVCADLVALDQMLVYNRFGSYNPFGMMFALRRDVVPVSEEPQFYDADACGKLDGTETYSGGMALEAGKVRLEDCKRPRPLVLRANAGDVLRLRLTNLLRPQPGFSETYCRQGDGKENVGPLYRTIRAWLTEGGRTDLEREQVDCMTRSSGMASKDAKPGDAEWPRTRGINFAIQGLTALPKADGKVDPRCTGLDTIAPGGELVCTYRVDREGTYFLSSTGAPSGGQGGGGSITHGLFGAVVGEPSDSQWYRSQVTQAAFRAAWPAKQGEGVARHAVDGMEKTGAYEILGKGGVPILNMLAERGKGLVEIVHTDLNAIVYRDGDRNSTDPEKRLINFREFSVFFHDELKAFYTRNFAELGTFGEGQLAGVRDGFGINYGASGMGTALLANRKGIGPAANCVECLYEEFFLTSWANGDPALLEQFSDDPSNVHHSYLNDRVVFRNFHAGPKETHVFHLHAHQWFAGNDENRGSYLDSQTVAPQQGFTYNIYGGGLQIYHKGKNRGKGWYETLGSGNRNRTLGDSIFHCHLYPHFAQGMWELWRVHDVLEDGSRKLPDGQKEAGLSLAEMDKQTRLHKRPGSVHPLTGAWIDYADGEGRNIGTPVPALIPLIGQAWPLLPTYSGETTVAGAAEPTAEADEAVTSMPGYPFYIAGRPGHRPSQAPLDIARAVGPDDTVGKDYLDGGLPRHVVTDEAEREFGIAIPEGFLAKFAPDGIRSLADAVSNVALRAREMKQSQVVAKMLAMGDMTAHMKKAKLELFSYEGTPLERAAMGFHHNGKVGNTDLSLKRADGSDAVFSATQGGYAASAATDPFFFAVNGSKPKPGSPFADPCGAPDGYQDVRREGADKYFVGASQVFAADAGMAVQPGGAHVGATDADVSNWMKWKRGSLPLVAERKVLYYLDGGKVTELEASGGIAISEADPFLKGLNDNLFTSDPGVIGFRRYEASAVQLDLVTNRAGWHDPQARINVLTKRSTLYKDGGTVSDERRIGRISPKISANEEPFFFRALSGECIEFRHTNELPKELDLDDFQLRTPTDTIGQHIHLVKFDVTASDGSGNGFNYEDGTFAPDEIAARICAAKDAGMAVNASRSAGALEIREKNGLCEFKDGHWTVSNEYKDKIWRLPIDENRQLFQTTVQRWFADPILSPAREGDDTDIVDRTLRTVFSHDHFGPSSIQQHGFYTALVIEPQASQTCGMAPGADCTASRKDRSLVKANDLDVGAAKIVYDPDALDQESPDYQEFALAIADFATLYDPRDGTTEWKLQAAMPKRETDMSFKEKAEPEEVSAAEKGMAKLLCEARYAVAGQPGNMRYFCSSKLEKDGHGVFATKGDAPPAWLARDKTLMTLQDVKTLEEHLLRYRRMAAGFAGDDKTAWLANPVSPPERSESISVDHHDPYLLNYRGEPLALRLGMSASGGIGCDLKGLAYWVEKLSIGVKERCSISTQKPGKDGDPANVFLSALHGDPVTPIMQAYSQNKVLFRLIQGAQEVQHTFTLEGYNWPRNIDQRFPSAMLPLDDKTVYKAAPYQKTYSKACADAEATLTSGAIRLSRTGRADQYHAWLRYGFRQPPVFDAVVKGTEDEPAYPSWHSGAGWDDYKDYWKAYEAYIAACTNAEGRITAQEVGISEHFEFAGAYRNDLNAGERTFVEERLKRSDAAELLARADRTPTDNLLHFGSQDALWNGAWGLLRVFKDPATIDRDGRPAGVKVRDFADLFSSLGKRNAELRPLTADEATALRTREIDAGTQVAACPADAPILHAAVVAVETANVFGPTAPIYDEGTRYGDTLYDRNGLFLALVDPTRIAKADRSGRSLDDWLSAPGSWQGLRRSDVVEAIKAAYSRPEPFVLPVRAGDCVKLTVINALTEQRSGGLKDNLGDAHMPKIVPLNVEPRWSEDEPEVTVGEKAHAFEKKNGINLRPSARLALMLPLPVLNHMQLIARPFGGNLTGALAATPADKVNARLSMVIGETNNALRTAEIEQLVFYAGRTGTPIKFDPAGSLRETRSTGALKATFEAAFDRALASKNIKGSQVQIGEDIAGTARKPYPFGGKIFTLNVDTASGSKELIELIGDDEALARQVDLIWSKVTQVHVGSLLHFIPYAYGSLPIKSVGDVIGQPTHGLVGSINVLPVGAEFEMAGAVTLSAGALRTAADFCLPEMAARPRQCSVATIGHQKLPKTGGIPFGQMLVKLEDEKLGEHTIRDFTLFFQDGLNLRDTKTRDRFNWFRFPPKLVADCAVCDDSYDLGDQGVSYRSSPYHIRLRGQSGNDLLRPPERHFDLNAYDFGRQFFALKSNEVGVVADPSMPVLRATEGDEVVIHVVHPGGRARQHSFVTIAQDYDDLFPGFGFPHSALLTPGKALTASLRRPVLAGCYLWFSGPTHLQAGGLWGLLDVVPKDTVDTAVTSCKRGNLNPYPQQKAEGSKQDGAAVLK